MRGLGQNVRGDILPSDTGLRGDSSFFLSKDDEDTSETADSCFRLYILGLSVQCSTWS